MEQQSTALQKLAKRRRRIAQFGAGTAIIVFGLVVSINWWPHAKPATKLGPVDWHPLTSPAGRFIASMPGSPKERIRQAVFLNKPMPLHLFEGESSDINYVIGFGDFPAGTKSAYSDSELLSASRTIIDIIPNGKLADEHPVSLGNISGRERRLEETSTIDPRRAVLRVYIVNGRMYQLVAFGTATFDELMQGASQLFASFHPTP